MPTGTKKTLVAYVASPHGGYLKLFRQYQGGVLYVLGREFIEEQKSLVRHLPGNDPEDAVRMIRALGIFRAVGELKKGALKLNTLPGVLYMPDEDVSRAVAERYFADREVYFDSRWKLRYDLTATVHHRKPEGETVVSVQELDRALVGQARAAAQRSPDWWRQVGAVLVRDGKVILAASNTHLPSEQSAYVMGDPRSNFDAGQHIDASLALHGEAGIVAEAARRGITTTGCDLYVTTFPCPPCANLIAQSGIRRLFYADGYSLVAGAEALRSRNVEIIRVEMQDAPVPV